ncbi:MAG: response regulator, partial [Gammaproteobacteria bacterium]|nr:response regulator [Gammaproteobacteria bacterium]
NDVLDFSKIESGKLEFDEQDFQIHDLIGDSMKALAVTAHERGIEVTTRIGQDVPRVLIGDASRLRQILVNLVGNAIKYTDQGEVVLRLSCERKEDEHGWLRFVVTDTGIGIGEDAQRYIFEAFSQTAGSANRRSGGSGLGLSISRRLVQLMGGDLRVSSLPEMGSSFSFAVPLKPVQSDRDIDSPRCQPAHVLVVQRLASTREMLHQQLLELGAPHVCVASAGEALGQLEQGSAGAGFDAMLLERDLPDMDGLDLASRIRLTRTGPGPRLILLEGGLADQQPQHWALAGIETRLSKPPRLLELHEALLAKDVSDQGLDPIASYEAEPLNARLLLAEDHPVNQEMAMAMLDLLGCEVVVVETGREAVDGRFHGKFDMLLMDCDMPDMDGFEATDRIRQLERDRGLQALPIIALTANALSGDRERCIEAGMNDYLSKPISLSRLREAIVKWVPQRTTNRPAGITTPDSQSAGLA